ncbi:MAG: hypothetical protein M1831_000419 [Alyxoria varia]|nr:MAG: hypothetical protein M1831_000419 [Alyxoria varia]
MAPITQASNESNHQELMDKLDVYAVRKPFRHPSWKAAQRRNKNVRQIISEAARKQEASLLATQENSRTSTPIPDGTSPATGDATPTAGNTPQPNLAQASQNLSTLVLEKNAQEKLAQNGPVAPIVPSVSYTSIESAPSLHPSSQRHYCDITGLPAPYTDPKSRLRYHNGEVFAVVRNLGQHLTESYLAARGAHTVLK